MKIAALTTTGLSETTINSPVLETPVNSFLLAQAIRVYLSRRRQGTAKVKTRADVSRTKKKWYKQKHTGGARHGARTPNIFVGGGVSHGPDGMQNWMLHFNQQMKRQALATALAAQRDQMIVVDFTLAAKDLRNGLKTIEADRILIITPATQFETVKAVGNMSNVAVTTAARVTALEVLNAHKVVVSTDTLTALASRVGVTEPTAPAKAVAKPAKATKKATTKTT